MRCPIKIILKGVESGGDSGAEVRVAWERRMAFRDRETCAERKSGRSRSSMWLLSVSCPLTHTCKGNLVLPITATLR